MKVIAVENPKWNNAEHTSVDCAVTLDGYADVFPFTAVANDSEHYGQQLFAALVAGEYGIIAEYMEALSDG